jgi:heptosyltransferase-2
MARQQSAPDLGNVRRILIIKWSALGDVALASAIMEDVRRAFPHARIDLNTLAPAARFFAHDPRFDEVFCIDVRQKGRRMRRWIEWIRRVRKARYDLLIDLQASDHSRMLIAALLLAGHRIRHRLGNRGGFPYTLTPAVRDRQAHAIDQMRSVLHAAGIPARTAVPVLHPAPDDLATAARVLAQHGLHESRFAVLMPGSQLRGRIKRWGWQRYAELGRLLLADGAIERIVVVGGPDEADECSQIVAALNEARTGSAVNLHMLPLLQIVPVCERAACIVANDTGNAHIAAAAGRPLVVLCGPTDPRRVRPIGDHVIALQAKSDCLNCYARACAHAPEPLCLARIAPRDVMQALASGTAGDVAVFRNVPSAPAMI